jgi:hypothetical protein
MPKLPDALERRELLYGSKRTPDFEAQGRAYLESDQRSEALEFFLKVADPGKRSELLREVRDAGVADGNWFLLNRLHGVEALPDAVWQKAFDKAQELGKKHYALKIAKQLGDAESTQALELELGLRQPEPEPEPESVDGDPEAEAEAAG